MAGRNLKIIDQQAGKDAPPLPNNIEAEQQLLGAILVNNEAYARIAHLLEPEDFYDGIHQQFYEVIKFIVGKGQVATPVTMKGYLVEIDMGDIDMTAQAYAALLCSAATTVVNCPDYAAIVKDLSIQRQLFHFYEQQKNRILIKDPRDTSITLIDEAEEFVGNVRPIGQRADQFMPFSHAVARAQETASAAFHRGAVISGTSTGLKDLDNVLGGLNRGELIVIAGRPAMGKTALAVNIAYQIARDLAERRLNKEKTGVVGFSSLEMPSEQLAGRIMSEHSKVSSWRVRGGKASEEEVQRYLDSGDMLKNLPLFIDQTGALPISSLMMRARALRKRQGIEILLVDYLQLLKGSTSDTKKEVNRVQELTEITGSLKALAKELDIPVVALSQLSRQVEMREDKRPKLADLRESGSIEQDADSVIFCYRDEYYLKQEEPAPGTDRHNDWKLKIEAAHGRAELIVGKNRHGPAETVPVGYNAAIMQFNNDIPDASAAPAHEKREKQAKPKALRLPAEATIALGELRTLMLTKSVENESLVGNAPKGVRLVKYVLWREKCAAQSNDPSRTEKDAVALMERSVKPLLAAKLVGRGGSKEDPYCWIVPEK